MLRAAIAFFLIGLLAMFLGASNVAGLSIEVGRILLIIFVVLAVLSLITSMARGKGGKGLSWALIATLGLGQGLSVPVQAEETTGEKVEAAANEAATKTKKAGRKVKRSARNAVGKESKIEDAKDSAKNVGDQVSDEAEEAKNKID